MDLEGRAQQGGASLRVRKRFRLASDTPRLAVEYRLEFQRMAASGRFGVELNLAFYMGPPPDRVVEINGQRAADPSLFAVAETPGVREVRVVDAWLGFASPFSHDASGTLWRCPVQTIVQSEGGYEQVAQQVALLACWPLGGAEGVRELTLSLCIESWEAAGGERDGGHARDRHPEPPGPSRPGGRAIRARRRDASRPRSRSRPAGKR